MAKKPKKSAIIITAEGFEDEEVIYAAIRLKEGGFIVDIATKDKKLVNGRLGFPLELLVKYYARLVDSLKLDPRKYDLIFIPGGFEAPDRIRQIPEITEFLKEVNKRGKTIAAWCHGPRILISAGIIKDKRATCYQGMADDLKNAGAIYMDQPVVIDGNIITGRHPRDAGDLMETIFSRFKEIK